ncbi:WS/DGAT/MGAT family O-acyltransferase [Blastococcus tunisiensis]|nr:wax ester/triacylglycerol synthase family O-acyltransferase [Blastococcus sp. DSM 46838]
MSPLDAAFLQAEDEEPGASLAIASIAVFEGPAPTTAEFRAVLTGRLPLIPRYRQKAREVPFDLGPPVWVDGGAFDLDYHLRRTALPAPGGDRELALLMGRLMSARLDRNRPLWEYWLVEGLSDDRWALVSKVHHCMVDGVSGTDLYRVVLDATPEPRPPVTDEWRPAPEPSDLRLTAAAALDAARLPVTALRALAGAARSPAALGRQAWHTVSGLGALATALVPATRSTLSGPPSAERRFAFARASVADVGTVRSVLGGTFNDVALAAVTAGLRRLLLERGELPTAHAVRTLIPVSVRAPGTEDVRDNQVSLLLAELPVHLADPEERLAAVRQEVARLKAEHEAEAGAAVVELARYGPFAAVAASVRLAAHLPQRSIVTVTTNVPGPREPLYALGRRLVEIIPYVPIASRLRLGVAIFSYCGSLTVGITGDYDGAADVEVLAQGIEDGMAELVTLAGARTRTRAPQDSRRTRRTAPRTGSGDAPRPRG